MGHSNYNDRQAIFNLISKYEDMLEKNQVKFTNHQSFHALVDYYERECLLDRALEVVSHAILQTGHEASFCLRKAGMYGGVKHQYR